MATVKKDNKLMALLSVWGILLVLLGHSGFEEPEIQQKLGWQHWNLVVLGMFLGGLVLPLLVCRAVDGMKWTGQSRWLRIAIGY